MKIMKVVPVTILQLFLLVMIPLKSFSQGNKPNKQITKNNLAETRKDSLPLYNLYFISKYLNAKLDDSEKIQVYQALIAAIGNEKAKAALITYQNASENEKYSDIVGAFLNDRAVERQQFRQQIINDFKTGSINDYEGKSNARLIKENIQQAITRDKEITKKKRTIDTLTNSVKTANLIYIKIDKELAQIFKKDSITNVDIDSMLDSIKKEIKTDSIRNKAAYDQLEDFANNYVEERFPKKNYSNRPFSTNETDFTTTEININSIIQSAEQRAATNSFSLPSESDFLEAAAMFLASRAQQEAVIWFMDQVRNNLNNPLIYEAFPETIKHIESLEDYKAPNFNPDWRNAISSDFVKMPVNLANGNWVKNVIFKGDTQKVAVFSTSVNFGYQLNRLISEKSNYRDIIRYFYTSPIFEYDVNSKNILKNNKAQKLISHSVSILYVLTNEFFAVERQNSDQHFRLLTYEEITSLDQFQWTALGQLIKLKYGSKFDIENSFFKNEFNNNQENLSKWAGNLLITLSQFDKVNKDFQKALKNKNDLPNYNFYNVWQITSQIIDNIDYKLYLNSNLSSAENLKNEFEFSTIKECLDIYNQIQNKNYSAGIRKTINILENLSSKNNVYELPAFKFNNVKVQFRYIEKDILLTDGEVVSNVNLNLTEDVLEFKIKNDIVNNVYKIKNYSSIQPFLRFVKGGINDENYNLVEAINPEFDSIISTIATDLKVEKLFVVELLKVQSIYDSQGSNQDKLLTFIKSCEYIYNDNKDSKKDIDKIKYKYQDKLFKIAAFFSDVLEAKSEQDLANVIDSHALPPASYKLKRKVAFSIDLNGYVGIQGSRILTNGYTTLNQQYTAGITAPVGFAFTWSTKESKPDNYGFTIDLIDLGNIVNHYLVSSSEEYEKDVHFSEVFSVSSTFIYGIRKTPFVVFAGIKFLPLKTSTSDDGRLINNKAFDATLFNVGVKIDIPLVNLWTKIHD